MSDPTFGRRALAVLCALAAVCLPATAQDAASSQQRIVVTAARTEQALPDALPSTRVITRAEIESTQATDLVGLLRASTSIDVAATGPLGSQASLFLRGADSRQTLVLVDGVPFARADFGTASWQYLPLDQIERIEIVRGNHSALYGASAVGGVVHVITRRATAPQATLGIGSQGMQLAAAAAGRRWGEGDTATQLSGTLSWRRTDGFSARDPAQDASANPDRDGARQEGASLRVDQGWGRGHRTQLALTSSRTRSDYDGFAPGLPDRLTTRTHTLALITRHALAPDLAFEAEAGQTREHFDDPTGFTTEADNRVRNFAAALRWVPDTRHDLLLGAESRRDRYGASGASARSRTTDALRLGWLGRLGPAWQAQLNARHDRSSAFGSATTGLAALAYAFAAEWKATAQLSSGFSPPSFLDEQFADPALALRAERSRQAELALQWRGSASDASSARVALFAQRQRDRIAFDPVTFEAVNIARARNRGFELMAQVPIAVGSVNAEVTLQDPRDSDSGTPLKRRAKQSLALGWLGDVDGWSLRASLRHAGRRLDTDPVTFGDAYNPARSTLSLGVAREVAPGWRLSLALDNAAAARRPEVLGYTAPPRSAVLTLQGTSR